MDHWLAISIVLVGIILMLVEIFLIPGAGIAGIIGLLLMISGVAIGFAVNSTFGWYNLAGTMVLFTILLSFAFRRNTWSRFTLKNSIEEKVVSSTDVGLNVHDIGKAVSRLAPMGKARFGNLYVEVTAWNNFIDEDEEIVIHQIEDKTIFVKSKSS
ncbi:MAG TPA: hypothetical protein DDX92_12170 [Flavobacteriales bacterium]|jgi:membrane-bound ClpP family serine protease|nr:hypothetical protein [Flavobacteriales bacterium]